MGLVRGLRGERAPEPKDRAGEYQTQEVAGRGPPAHRSTEGGLWVTAGQVAKMVK